MSDHVERIDASDGMSFVYSPKQKELAVGLGLSFVYNMEIGLFEVDQNPYDERELIPISDLQFSTDFSKMTFSCNYRGMWQIFEMSINSDKGKLLAKFMHLVHGNCFPFFEKHYQPFLYQDFDGEILIKSTSLNPSIDKTNPLYSLRIVSNQGIFSQVVSALREKLPLTAFDITGDKVVLQNTKGINEFQIVTEENVWATAKALIQNALSHLPHISV